MKTHNCDGCGVKLPSEADGRLGVRISAHGIAMNVGLRCKCPHSGEQLIFCFKCRNEVFHAASRQLKPIPIETIVGMMRDARQDFDLSYD